MPNITFLTPPLPEPINTVTANTYTLVVTDQRNGILCTNTTNVVVSIANNSTVPIPLGATIPIREGNTGIITITAGSGVTLLSPNGANTSGSAGDSRVLEQVVIDTWVVW